MRNYTWTHEWERQVLRCGLPESVRWPENVSDRSRLQKVPTALSCMLSACLTQQMLTICSSCIVQPCTSLTTAIGRLSSADGDNDKLIFGVASSATAAATTQQPSSSSSSYDVLVL